MCLCARVLLVGSYVPFSKGVGDRQFCAFQVGFCGRQICVLLVGVALVVGCCW
jgi:hypothetical protein